MFVFVMFSLKLKCDSNQSAYAYRFKHAPYKNSLTHVAKGTLELQ